MEKAQRFLKGNPKEPMITPSGKFTSRLLAVVPHMPVELILINGISLKAPSWAISEEILVCQGEELVHHLKTWGFNGLLIGLTKQQEYPLRRVNGSLKTLAELLERNGIDLILAYSDHMAQAHFNESLSSLVHYCLDLGIHSLFLDLKSLTVKKRPREMTRLDLLEVEVAQILSIAKGLNCFLHLNLPEKCDLTPFEGLLARLPAVITPSTRLVFSSYVGRSWERNERYHPLWKTLAEATLPWNFPLVPVVDSGGVGLGGGLWPLSTAEELIRILEFSAIQSLSGAIITCSSIPVLDSFSSANLRAAGKILCGISTTQLKCKEPQQQELLQENYRMVKRINCYCQGNGGGHGDREFGELLLMELSHLRQRAEGLETNLRFEYCYRDLRRIVAYELQMRQLPLPKSYLFSEEGGAGFWTEVEGGKMPVGYLASPKIKKLKVPSKGEEGSQQRVLFGENDLFIQPL